MLNALRHQRCVQAFAHCGSGTILKCSTPYGIKGVSRKIFPAPEDLLAVLNALRHQRCVQLRPGLASAGSAQCSTPYGIKGVSSSTSSRGKAKSLVLNALRHQRCVQVRVEPRECLLQGGAQRLTASKVCPAAPNPAQGSIRLCSTPYGIKGVSSLVWT